MNLVTIDVASGRWIDGAANATLTQKVHGDVTLPAPIKASRRPRSPSFNVKHMKFNMKQMPST